MMLLPATRHWYGAKSGLSGGIIVDGSTVLGPPATAAGAKAASPAASRVARARRVLCMIASWWLWRQDARRRAVGCLPGHHGRWLRETASRSPPPRLRRGESRTG